MKNMLRVVFVTLVPLTVSVHGDHGSTDSSLIHALLHSELLQVSAVALVAALGALGLIRAALNHR